MRDLPFTDDFAKLNNWVQEGAGSMSAHGGAMHIECIASQQGGVGCMAFCRHDFPDRIAVEYNLTVRESNGLFITFVALRGLNGEDFLSGLPPRSGEFKDYTGDDALARSYHVSVSRYDDAGVHTGVSNWRRNPGLHLMAQGVDLCEQIGRTYAVRIEKDGPRCALFINGQPGPAFVDPAELPDELPTGGKIGFRAIGSRVIADVSKLRVSLL
jgi:Domain of unknown function (DUF1961)